MKKLKPLSWVVRTKDYDGYPSPFKKGELYIYVGEITNSPGHGIFLKRSKKDGGANLVYDMYHLHDFRMATDDEV